jgi:hypothetical protein
MFWIDISKTGTGAVVMLSAQQNFNKDFLSGIVLWRIVECRAQNRAKLKTRGTFLNLDNAPPYFTSEKYDEYGIKRLPDRHTVSI